MAYRSRRPSLQPLVPGQRCPAERSNKHSDPAVTITRTDRHSREGTRTCGKCGRPNVKVTQAFGERSSAWYYSWHDVPEKDSP